MTIEAWDFPGTGFGDLWAALSFCLHKSAETGEPQYISRWAGETDVKPRLEEMLSVIDGGVAQVIVSDSKPTRSMHMDCWAGRRWPTKQRWSLERHGTGVIAHQLDGISSAHLKNPPAREFDLLCQWANKSTIRLVPVGLPLSLIECVNDLATADAFVGVCSGMAHLAHSVGVPVYLLEYQHAVQWWHGENPITICAGVQEFIEAFRKPKP